MTITNSRATLNDEAPVTSSSPRRSRQGVALMLSLIALILFGIMAAALAHVTMGESRRLHGQKARTHVDAAADQAAYSVARDWIPGLNDTLQPGQLLPFATSVANGLHTATRTTRLSGTTWWTSTVSEFRDSSRVHSRRSVNVLWRLTRPEPLVLAALTVRDTVTLGASSVVTGTDSTAIAQTFCAAAAPVAGIAIPDTGRLCDGTCGSGPGTRVIGAPPVTLDTITLDTATYSAFGGESWSSLIALADIRLPHGSIVTPAPSTTGSICDRFRTDNWGDPFGSSTCRLYAPIIHVRGDAEMRGGVGQGILLVDGDLVLSQSARFSGLVVTADDLIASTGANTIWGSVLARDRRPGAGDHTTLGDQSAIRYSSCALETVYRRSGRLVPVKERSWAVIR